MYLYIIIIMHQENNLDFFQYQNQQYNFEKLNQQSLAITKFQPQMGNSDQKQHPQIDTSFQNNLSQEHCKAIWNASIQYLKNSLKSKFDEKKGFNDENMLQCNIEIKEQLSDKTEIFQLIKKNQILQYDQKNRFISALKNSKYLKELVKKLSENFCEQIMQQLIILLFQSWQHYSLYKETTKLSVQLARFLSPSYTNIDSAQNQPKQSNKLYISQKQSEICSKASEAAMQISSSYFVSTKLRYLNLKQIDLAMHKSNVVRVQFQKFIETITIGVYLCAEGCFTNPGQEKFKQKQQSQIFFSEREVQEQSDIKPQSNKRRNI